jgi:serine protease Do
MILRKLFLFMISILFALFPEATRADSSDINAASRSVVRVAVFSTIDGTRKLVGHGSGIVVAPDKIITNAHVVEESVYNENITFEIIPSQGREVFMATVLKWSPENDLALLQLEQGAKLTPASLYTGAVEDGADVFAIGYPASVDIAMELNEEDILRPQSPVKTRGTVSAGRSAKAFDTLLHTAPIAPGNSGGPMVDNCGRVVGINSFGSTAENGGSEFYFAVSMKETLAFLSAQKVKANIVSGPCRSVAELSREEETREAKARANIEAQRRAGAELAATVESKTRRDVELSIISERESHLALAGLLMLLALGGAGASYALFDQDKRNPAKIAGITAAILVLVAIGAYMGRPSYTEVDDRLKALMSNNIKEGPANITAKQGRKICTVQLDRSRVTASNTADVQFDWKSSGCINGRTQYAKNGESWTRSFVPDSDAQVSIVSFEPTRNKYRIDRYLLGFEAMEKAREARRRYNAKSCTSGSEAMANVGKMNEAVRNVLPENPNELLIFACADGL